METTQQKQMTMLYSVLGRGGGTRNLASIFQGIFRVHDGEKPTSV